MSLPCRVCGAVSARPEVVLLDGPAAYCTTACAQQHGWPWLQSEPALAGRQHTREDETMARKPKQTTTDAAQDAAQDQLEDDEIDQLTINVALETLTGDIRDFILDRLRHEQDKRAWHLRSEAEQRDTVHKVEAAVREVLTKALEIIAAGGRRTIAATLEQVTVKDGIAGKLVMLRSDPLRHLLFDSVGARVLIVVADPDRFTGERAEVDIKPDQGDIERLEKVGVVHSSEDADKLADKPFH